MRPGGRKRAPPRGRDRAQRGGAACQRDPGQDRGAARLLEREAERLGQRIDCLSRNRDALLRYLAAVRGSLPDGAGEQGDLVR